MSDQAARRRLDRWKQSLLDPNERLFDLGGEDGLGIAVDPVRIAFSLAAGSTLAFEPGAESGFDAGRLRVPLASDELSRELRRLRLSVNAGRANAEHVLWFALGMLTWIDEGGLLRRAPLALWPVELVMAADGSPRLRASRDMHPRINEPLFDHLLRTRDIALSTGPDFDLGALLEHVGAIVGTLEGWSLERTSRLVTLSFASFDLWRDLDAAGDSLFASTPARWLAGEDTPPALVAGGGEDLLAPLDADASQIAAISAAAAGNSFVLHGAPGTGKSQTIANLAIHCASHGKTVLVVSDRASALDVVHSRLAAVGLGELCLPLHAGRKRVLDTLGRVFDRTFKPVAGISFGNGRLVELRTSLDAYTAALHKVGPLGMSVHDVLGRLVELRTTPRAALADRDAAALDAGTFTRRRAAVRALADAGAAVEPVAGHPWRSSAVESSSAHDTARVTAALDNAASAIDALTSALTEVAALVPGFVARTHDQLRALGALADLAAGSPRPGAELLTSMRGARHDDIGERVALIRARGGGTLDIPRDPGSFLAIATRHRALAAEVEELFTELVDEVPAAELWSQLKRWSSSVAAVRYMALRSVRLAIKVAAQSGQLETDEAMLGALEAVIAERACRDALLAAAEPARRWFGELGGDPLTLDLSRIEDAVTWGIELRKSFEQVTITGGEVSRQAAWRSLVAQVSASSSSVDHSTGVSLPFARLAAAILRWEPSLVELAAASGVPSTQLGAGPDHLVALREQVATLRLAVGSFTNWTRFHLARYAADVVGVGSAVAAIERGDLDTSELADAWERATLLAWLDCEIEETPALAAFQGATHHSHVAAFADLDRGALALVRARAVARIAERMPRAKDSSDPELVALKQELEAAKPRPLRTTLSELSTLLPRIAPIMLASPHALAEHLDRALPAFDVVVFDEASRLPVSSALGAIARATSMIVVADARQLAPVDGSEGLLDVALAAKLPSLSLATHYRSRHEDLFAFVNTRFYNNRVEMFPAAHSSAELGIAWRHVDGVADEHGCNRAEAEAIVADVRARLADAAQRPRTFAIVALSHAQQALIEELLDSACVADLALSAARGADGEHLLVGTPDRLQGEERDVVYLSLGDAGQAIEALSSPQAQPALSVALTRAREHLTIVSSFTPEDLSTRTEALLLCELLAFARARGGAGKPADVAEAASPIMAALARSLTDRGWTLKHQVGSGPYKIDLAVVDPNDPSRYVLAIEHDGRTYASAGSARSRDRLRVQLLTQLGWRVHRVWSLDWWLDAEREIQRAHGAIVAAIASTRQRRMTLQPGPRPVRARTSLAPRITTPPVVPITPEATRLDDTLRTSAASLAAGSGPTDALDMQWTLDEGSGPVTKVRLPRGAIGIGPYTAAAVPAGRRAPSDMFAPRYAGELQKCIEQVLAVEAPLHIDVLARRVGAYFGVGRVTPPVLEQIKAALVGRGKLGDEPGIVWRADQDPSSVPPVRVAGQSATARRDITEVPLSEVAAAARIVVERASGVAATDLVRDCARLLGFARITEQVTARVSQGVKLATARELISIDAGKAHLMLD